ncbi:PIN2/TERF1-interacting telomerase inhibitor 1 [Cyphomyrmex costatus]|uniref:PIN2/TERF1-interacting telomerase inhibitor 1 n=1 Tax=Cyphomyrmex costatus TaxID=456900 RepID=A0A195D0K6_9HYME|nr:PIN2/TERF1-interacting telomerase inhibitor 1 [Cyphomyrmex costatus]
MSMLAERRQKQKWTLNPRGKLWTEDSKKYGQRMMEKMGWTKGKGLGIHEQGIPEFSSTIFKNDTTGIGYDKNFEPWIEHQKNFEDILQQLSRNQDPDTVEKSVNADANINEQSTELKSKQSHARVHYKKFTRGKDVNRYKSKDLANIFGQKALVEKTQVMIEKNDNIREETDVRDNWYGVTTINGGNMFDYFKLKAQFGLENCGLDLTDEKNKKRVTFNDHVMLYNYNINSNKKKKKKEATLDKFEVESKKNRKKRKHESIAISTMNGFVNEALDVQILFEEINDNELNEHKNKKIKKRRITKTSNLETIQESPEKEVEIIIESENTLDSSIIKNGEIDNMEQKSKKKKKKDKKKKRAKVEDTTVLSTINEEPDIEIIEIISNKKIPNTKDDKEEEETGGIIPKKCKKKKKKDKENYKNEKHIQTEINNDQQDNKILDKSKYQNNYKKKIKQKKKKRKSINEDECSNEIKLCNIEKKISNKENADIEEDSNTKKLAKKDKKSKKLKDKNVFVIEDSSNPNEKVVDLNVTKQDNIEKSEFTDTPLKKGKMIDAIDSIINSPWSVKARMSKKMLITFFHNNAILEFPGSNIHNIKGYGTDVEYE